MTMSKTDATATYAEPVPGEHYRDRMTGMVVRLLHCRREQNLIGCVFDAQEWWGTSRDFWRQFESEKAGN